MKHITTRRALTSTHFSKLNLLIFFLVFAAIGGYILLHSYAAPLVSVTSPSVGSTVSGTITLKATCDSCQAVEFRVNGNVVGVDVTAPYSFTWDSALIKDGSQTITAVAKMGDPNPSSWTAWTSTSSSPVSVTTSNGTGSATANLWVDSSTGSDTTCTRSASPIVFTLAAPCATPAKAVSLASANDIVIVRSGDGSNYGTISLANTSGLTFSGDYQDGQAPPLFSRFGANGASNITVKHLRFDYIGTSIPGFDFRQVSTGLAQYIETEGPMTVRGSDNVTFDRAYIHDGPLYTDATAQGFLGGLGVAAYTYTGIRTTNFTFKNSWEVHQAGDGILLNSVTGALVDHNVFNSGHPYGTGDHVDALQIEGGQGGGQSQDATYTNNYVINWQHGITITDSIPLDGPDADSRALIVENNVLSHQEGYSFNGPTGRNSLVVNNTFDTALGIGISSTVKSDTGSDNTGAIFENNIVAQGNLAADPLVTSDYNCVKAKTTSGTHDVVTGTIINLNPDYSLPTGSPCIGAGTVTLADSTSAPLTDMLGVSRSGSPDAGALEYVVPAEVWMSTSGDDATCVRGDQAKPCATFDKAYHIAQQGDTVEIAGGIYPNQTITYDATKTSANGNCRLTYNDGGTFNTDDSGCVTFQPAQGATVTIGCKTTTTADVDLTTQTTIPVASTSNCPLEPGQSYYSLKMSPSSGGIFCTGKDATDFTGCTPHSIPCYSGSGSRSGSQECHWYPGADVQIGSISVQASYVRVRDITISTGFTVQNKTNPVSDVIADGLTTSTSFWDGSYLFFENGLTGDTNDLGTSMYFSNTDHSGVYHSTNRNDTNIGMYNEDDYYNHPSNLYMNGNTNWYYVGNRNYNGQGSGLLFMSYNATYNPGPVTIVNNYFGKPYPGSTHTVTIDVGNGSSYPLSGYTIMGNSSVGLWDISDASTANINSSLVAGNIGVDWPCTGGGTYDVTIEYNVDSGTACSSTSSPIANNNLGGVSVASLWTDASINNLDLAGGPYSWEDQWASCPLAVDINGNSRPATCTAGADEPGSISPTTPGDLNKDGHVNVLDLSMLLSHYGNSATATQGDLNSDGMCTITDLSILLSHYGS